MKETYAFSSPHNQIFFVKTEKSTIITPSDKMTKLTKNIEHIRHSLAHLLAAAVLRKFPDAKLGIGPVIENGFYYDFDFNARTNADRTQTNAEKNPRKSASIQRKSTISEADLPEIEEEMRRLIRANLPFSGRKITASDAKKLFKKQPFKLDLIKEFSKEGKKLTIYITGDSPQGKKLMSNSLLANDYFTDLCKGGHVKNTKEISPDAFKLTHLAGAYWRGDEKNLQLQRIYGVAFETKQELDEYLRLREEAEKRDHKKLGIQLDLFTFSDLVGGGLPLWTPRGTLVRNLLDEYVWQLRKARGYVKVEIPHITKKNLYERSGHWDKFKEDLFTIKTREGHIFAMKPMNCPHHAQIYARRPWSYREMPQRYENTTMCYRDEQSGELSGLSRARSFTQDDAHVFCRHSQIKEEIFKIWDIIDEFYGSFGFPLKVRLSLHDSKEPKKYLGNPALWKKVEQALRDLAKQRDVKVFEGIGEAAFYGPKVDFIAKDSLDREWQVATIQLDMNMPERFDLSCINEKGKPERIVMLHAAIMGSIERFLSILIEHFAGAFPVWLAPVQAVVIPVSEKFSNYAIMVTERLKGKGIRADIADANETLGKRIREAELQKIPYILVVGEKEEKNKTVNVRRYRGGQPASAPNASAGRQGEMKIEKLIEKIQKEISDKTI